jgi:deoxyadenosine/deoxycytidine kinase
MLEHIRIGKLIILEGNISAGKSTLGVDLGKTLNIRIFLEPVISNPYLDKFYKDPKRYALRMQLWLLKQRYKTYIQSLRYILKTGRSILLDRSVFSDWVFAEKNRRDGNISEAGYQFYLKTRNQMLENLPVPHIVLFLDVSANECFRRVRVVRQRNCEAEIPFDYFSGLAECYDDFLCHMKEKGSSVLSIDWNSFGVTRDIIEKLSVHVNQMYITHWNTAQMKSLLFDENMADKAMKCSKFDDDWSDEDDVCDQFSGEECDDVHECEEDQVFSLESTAIISSFQKSSTISVTAPMALTVPSTILSSNDLSPPDHVVASNPMPNVFLPSVSRVKKSNQTNELIVW